MSHTTEIGEIVFKDMTALTAAVAEMQANGVRCSLVKDAAPRAYYQNQQGMGPANYVLKLDDAPYDVGFYKDDKKGGYVARTDLFLGHVARVLGAQAKTGESQSQAALGKLYQTYAVHATTRQAVKQGYSVRRVNKPDGTVSLVMNVG